jgi:hypothetical protein
MKYSIIALLLLAICISPACATTLNFTEKVGQNYIKWAWNVPSTPEYMIYVDGSFAVNTTNQYYYLNDLQASEEHRIDIYQYNAGKAITSGTSANIDSPTTIADFKYSKTSSTSMSDSLFYIVGGLLVILTVIAGNIKNPIKGLIFALVGIIVAILLALMAGSFLNTLIYLSIILGVVNTILLILHLQEIMKNTYIGW